MTDDQTKPHPASAMANEIASVLRKHGYWQVNATLRDDGGHEVVFQTREDFVAPRDEQSCAMEIYNPANASWAAPGDQQEDAWIVRFCDKDCRDAVFTGPDAEREAWEYWNRYAPAYNIYLFRLARIDTAALAEKDAEIAALREALTLAANRLHRLSVEFETGTVWFIEAGEWANEARSSLRQRGYVVMKGEG